MDASVLSSFWSCAGIAVLVIAVAIALRLVIGGPVRQTSVDVERWKAINRGIDVGHLVLGFGAKFLAAKVAGNGSKSLAGDSFLKGLLSKDAAAAKAAAAPNHNRGPIVRSAQTGVGEGLN